MYIDFFQSKRDLVFMYARDFRAIHFLSVIGALIGKRKRKTAYRHIVYTYR